VARTQSTYLPGLDGLRALAIIAVLLGHAGFTRVTGSAHGVSIFFVVSGYLITSLLLAERDRTGRIGLRAFYRRRFARLAPVLVLSVVVSIGYGLITDRSDSTLWIGAISALTYVMNLVVAFGGLAHGGAGWTLFRHTWSLAIEEQFYIVWPTVILITLRRHRELVLVWIAGAISIFALTDRIVLNAEHASTYRLAYGSDTRADALMFGCALAVLLRRDGFRVWAHRRATPMTVIGSVGLMVLVLQGAIVRLDPGGYSAAAFCTALVVAAVVANDSTVSATFLAGRVLTAIGRLSYGIYLWNVLLLEGFEKVVGQQPARTPLGPLWLLATAGVAWASYRWVETPLRRRWRERRSDDVSDGPVLSLVQPVSTVER
jgi:peptidoglycan/LPS O-acetylase OafA/YrhL